VWRRAVRRAGLPVGFGLHGLRHYLRTLLIHNGAAVKTVQLTLGHSSPVITLNAYAHEWPDALDWTRSLVNAELGLRATVTPSEQQILVAPCTAPVPDRAARGESAGQPAVSRYSPRLEMYCTTPSGTRYHTGLPSATRRRQSVEEIAIAGTSTRVTTPSGRWSSSSS
jgi:hypothetical protein